MNSLTSSLEDYLEIICNYADSNQQVRAVDISKELNVSRASTSEALKKLANKGFINYGRYGVISITASGKELAHNIISKHKTLQEFFENIGLSKEDASYNACKIEHVITDSAFNKISEFLGRENR